MSEEAAFLEALKANPDDDTARLVYADWLDEYGEPEKAEYLRLVAALAMREDNLQAAGEAKSLLDVAERLPEEWRAVAGSRFDLVLHGWVDKIRAIKWIREATGDGLGEAKAASESLPHTVFHRVRFELAWAGHESATRTASGGTRILTSPEGPQQADGLYDLVVGYSIFSSISRRREAAEARRRAEQEMREAVAALFVRFGCSATEAAARTATGDQFLLATGLTLREARERSFALRSVVPAYDLQRGWALWIHRRRAPSTPAQD